MIGDFLNQPLSNRSVGRFGYTCDTKRRGYTMSVKKFLDFLTDDMQQNPDRVQPITEESFSEAKRLVRRVELDPEAISAPLPSDEDDED